MKGNSISGDNRFEIIEKAKEKLLNATNIEDSKEEMKVLTNILFRMWQVGLINEEKLEINKLQKENSIEEDMKILEGIIKGDEDCINAIYSQMKVKNDNDEDIQYYKKEIQSIKNIVDNYLKEKARADKLEKEYSAMLTESDENECDYKRVLKENEELKRLVAHKNGYTKKLEEDLFENCSNYVIPKQKVKDKIEEYKNMLKTCNKVKDIDRIKAINERILELEELLEGRK